MLLAKHFFFKKKCREFQENPLDYRTPGGESRREVGERMLNFVEEKVLPLIGDDREDVKKVAVFSHGTAIAMLLRFEWSFLLFVFLFVLVVVVIKMFNLLDSF